jgi:hypothetical protein
VTYDPLEDADAQWEEISVSVPPDGPSVVMSVRMSQALAGRLRAEARRRGIPTTTLVREVLAAGMRGPLAPPASAPMVSSPNAALTFYTGMAPGQRTAGDRP